MQLFAKLKERWPSPEKIWLFLVKAGILLISFTPFVFSPVNFFPTVFPQAIYFRCLVEIIFCFYVFLLLCRRDYLPKASPLFVAVSIFTLINVIATIFSVNPYRSFWGSLERSEGLISTLHLYIYFFIISGVLRNKKDFIWLLKTIVYPSVLLAYAGIMQKLGLALFGGAPDAGKPGLLGPFGFYRISSTSGNPILYAAYLVLIIFLSVFLAHYYSSEEKHRVKTIGFYALAAINLVMLFMTRGRGALIGLATGAVFIFGFWFLSVNKTRRIRLIILSSVLVILMLYLLTGFLTGRGIISKAALSLRGDVSLTELLLSPAKISRFQVWRLGIKAVSEKPIFGFGPEMFGYVFSRHYYPGLLSVIPENMHFDRAHNKLVNVVVDCGIVGLISYLYIYVCAIRALFNGKLRQVRAGSLIFGGFLIAYLVQNLFAFDTNVSYFVFLAALAAITNIYSEPGMASEILEDNGLLNNKNILLALKTLVAGIAILLTFVCVKNLNIVPFFANLQAQVGRVYLYRGQITKAVFHVNTAIALLTYGNQEYEFSVLGYLGEYDYYVRTDNTLDKQEKEMYYSEREALAGLLEANYADKPDINQINSCLLAAETYRDLYLATKNENYLAREEGVLRKVQEFSPLYPRTYRLLGEMYYLKGDEATGMAYLRKAYSLDNNIGKLKIWEGRGLISTGQNEKGARILREGLKISKFYFTDNFDFREIQRANDAYKNSNNDQELVEFLEEAVSLYASGLSKNPQMYELLAAAYRRIGNETRALEIERLMSE